MRTFLAIDLPTEAKKQIDEQIASIKKDYPVFNWVPMHNYHLTAHFYGEIDGVSQVKDKIEEAIYDIPAFMMYGLGAGLFIHQKIVAYVSMRRRRRRKTT